jgi:hypothetical protein
MPIVLQIGGCPKDIIIEAYPTATDKNLVKSVIDPPF